MLLASLHFFCCLASGVPIRAQLSPFVAEQRRWSFGPRVADFNNPLVCRVLRGSAKKFVILGSRQTFGGFRVDHKKHSGWTTVIDPLLGALVRMPQPPWHVFVEESRS